MNVKLLFSVVALSALYSFADGPAVTPEWVREEIARQVCAATNALYLSIQYGTTNPVEIARKEAEREERSKRLRGRLLDLKRLEEKRKRMAADGTVSPGTDGGAR